MKISKLYVGFSLSMTLLLLGGCDMEMNTLPQSEISNANTSSEMGIINTHTTIFDSISANLTENGGILNGKVDIVGLDKVNAIYFEMVDDIEIALDFSLVRYNGDLVIAYVSPDKTETIIADTSELDGDAVDHTVNLTLKKGSGKIEFSGDDTIYEFALTFQNLNPNNVTYFDIVPNQNN